MPATLRFSDIVRRASLHLYTAQHVLKKADPALGLPTAGSQGAHRAFTLPQAVRFAVAVKLVMGGVNIRHVLPIIQMCEARVRRVGVKGEGDNPRYQEDPKRPWSIQIVEDDLVQVSRPQSRTKADLVDPDAYYAISLRKLISVDKHPAILRQGGEAISTHRMNITLLERLLQD